MEDLRQSLTLYAYNILGSYEDAKDIVQDVFLRFSELDSRRIADKKNYLIRMVVNLSIDHKRKLKLQQDNYPGPWLPEPIATEDPHFAVHRREILSYSVLVLLEKLDSRQRAVFILKEAFDYDHDEIARVLGISVENSRKILSRAKNELRSDISVRPDSRQLDILHHYLAVLEGGDMQALELLLNHDITVMSDGGGKASAFRNVIKGVKSVGALLTGLYKKMYRHVSSEITWINHQPAISYLSEGEIITCQIFSIRNQQLDHVFFIRNPDKLRMLQKESLKTVTFFERSSF